MKRLNGLGPAWLVTFMVIGLAFEARAQFKLWDSLRFRSYLKISLSTSPNDHRRIGVQYEHLLNRKLTIGATADFVWVTDPLYGIPYFRNSKQMAFRIIPQMRYYFGKQAFKGFYAGVFALYEHLDFYYERGHRVGGGTSTGYQFLIVQKIPVDFNLLFGRIIETADVPALGDEVRPYYTATFVPMLNISVGVPVGSKRKV